MAAGRDDLHLPLEICREILTRLPVKSILRFRSVRKSWYSLISCPNFRNLNKNPNRVLIHLTKYDCDGSFSSHDKSFMESREHDEIPKSFLGPYGTGIVGSCNGLICLTKWGPTNDSSASATARAVNFLIWNPTIRKVVKLPSRTYNSNQFYIGFGFDSKTSDYKVLSSSDSPDTDFQIFDLRKGVWRDINPRGPNLWYHMDQYPDCYLDGAVHWSGQGILFSFNFSDECCRVINLPDSAGFVYNEDGSFVTTKCVTFGGLIHVIVFSKWYNGPAEMSQSCSVWAMKEYGVAESWTKVYDIDLRNAQVLPSIHISPYQFRLWEKGEILMVHAIPISVDDDEALKYREDLVVYNIRSRKSKCMFSVVREISNVCLYEESLVLMR